MATTFISGTTTIGGLIWARLNNIGNGTLATAGPLLTATYVAPTLSRVSTAGAPTPKTLFAPTTITFTTAPTAFAAVGISLPTAAPLDGAPLVVDYNGEIGCEPGTLLSLNYSVTTSTSVWQTTIWGMEVPV